MTRDTAGTGPVTAAMSDRRERTYRRVLASLTLLVAAWTLVWAVLTPPFRSPDEQNHVNSVLRLAYGGGWPPPGEALFSPVIEQAVVEAAYPSDLPGRYGERDDVLQFVDAVPVPREDRAVIDAAGALPPPGSDAEIDQMTQHPPAYYALGAVVLRVTGMADARWDQAMLVLRILDVVLFAATIPFAAAAARRLTGLRSVGLLAAPVVLLVPQAGHIMGSVNNDALVVLVCAVLTYLAVRIVTGDLRWRVALAVGVVLGLGLLTKVMVAFAVPMILAAYLLVPGAPRRTRVARAAVSMLVALVVGGWWWVRNVLTMGVVQPAGRERDLSLLSRVPDDEAVPLTISRIAQSFFGQLGWLEVRLDGDFVVLGSTTLIVAAATCLVLPGYRRVTAALLLLPAALAGGVAFNALDYHAETGVLVALQGRYVFGALAALSVVVAVAVWQVSGRSRRRVVVALPVVAVLAIIGAVAGLLWGFRGMYRGPDEPFEQAADRWQAWSPLETPALFLVVLACAALAVVAVIAVVRWAVVDWPDPLGALVRPEGSLGRDGDRGSGAEADLENPTRPAVDAATRRDAGP